MAEPLAYLITWTCRGTWLHGDPRGSVLRVGGQGLPAPLEADAGLEARTRRKLTSPRVCLSPHARRVVEGAIARVCAARAWRAHAVAVRSNHVHIVVTSPGYRPEDVMRQLKSWATRALRQNGLVGADAPPWTRHGSTRYLWDDPSLAAAVEYVEEWQDRPRG